MTIKRVTIDPRGKLNWFIYGPPGSGKTHLNATIVKTLKEGERIMYLDIGANRRTFLTVLGEKEVEDHVGFFTVDTYDDVDKFIMSAKKKVNEGNVKWIIVDVVNKLQKLILDELVGISRIKRSPSQGEWQICFNRLFDITERLLAINANVIYNCHTYGNSDAEMIMPALKGKTAPDEIAGMFDVILFLKSQKAESGKNATWLAYSQFVSGNLGNYARDCTGLLPAVFDPDFGLILDILSGRKKAEDHTEKASESW